MFTVDLLAGPSSQPELIESDLCCTLLLDLPFNLITIKQYDIQNSRYTKRCVENADNHLIDV